MTRFKKVGSRGFSHHLLLAVIVLVVGVGGVYWWLSSSHADAKTPEIATVTKSPITVRLYRTNDCITDYKGIVRAGNPIYLEKCNGGRDQKFGFQTGLYMTYGYTSRRILLCVGNPSKKGKAELLNCASPNAVFKPKYVAHGAGGLRFPGGFLEAPGFGQMKFVNNAHVNGREDFIGGYPG